MAHAIRKDIQRKMHQYAEDHNITYDIIINRALYRYLKMGKEMSLSDYVRFDLFEDQYICESLLITPGILARAKEEIKKVKALNLPHPQLKAQYAKIDKLAQF